MILPSALRSLSSLLPSPFSQSHHPPAPSLPHKQQRAINTSSQIKGINPTAPLPSPLPLPPSPSPSPIASISSFSLSLPHFKIPLLLLHLLLPTIYWKESLTQSRRTTTKRKSHLDISRHEVPTDQAPAQLLAYLKCVLGYLTCIFLGRTHTGLIRFFSLGKFERVGWAFVE